MSDTLRNSRGLEDYGTLKTQEEDATSRGNAKSSEDQLLQSGACDSRNSKAAQGAKGKVYPYSVYFILTNEFCERFSYYGMRAILVLYLTRWLKFERDKATSIFHAFSMMCYLMPFFGAILADGYIGRYKTILYLSWIYFVGNLIVSTTAVPPPEWIGPAVGLFLIAVGTGGIKSCVAPFGADQFCKGQEKERNAFFSAFYFMINLGSTISIIVTPILRADVYCFGMECYALAFGVPAILMFLSVLIFMAGDSMYQKIPPSGNIIGKTCKCISHGFWRSLRKRKDEEKRTHWLYYANDRFEMDFIEDVRLLLSVLLMFVPLPLFWALSDQQGSRWTLQAEHMSGDMGMFGTLKPDQLQALNPLLILILIPIFDKAIYPLLDKCKIPNRPLQRMVVGLYISASAFIVAGFVQIKLDHHIEPPLNGGECGVTLINTVPEIVTIQSQLYTGTLSKLSVTDFIRQKPGNYCVTGTLGSLHSTVNTTYIFNEASAYRLIFSRDGQKLMCGKFPDVRMKMKTGNAQVSVFSTLNSSAIPGVRFVPQNYGGVVTNETGSYFKLQQFSTSQYHELEPDSYTLYIPIVTSDSNTTSWSSTGFKVRLGYGGIYTAYVQGSRSQVNLTLFTSVEENKVSMLWMVPQYVLITVGEVLFSISGLSFAYSQAPHSLKSVVQAVWLLTVSVGDLVVIIVANIQAIPSQSVEYFLFAALMALDTTVFMVMSVFYKYKPNSLLTETSSEDTANLINSEGGEEIPLQTQDKQDKLE